MTVYTRPVPRPLRSARSRNVRSSVPTVASWISALVSPSPSPLSASLLVIETSLTFGFGSHVSLTVIVAVIWMSLWSGGQSTEGDSETVSSGGFVSVTCTVCVAVPVFPEASVADQLTGVSPRGKPDCGASLTGLTEGSHTSVADAVPSATLVVSPAHSAVTSAGALTVGGVVSTTVTLVVASAYAPCVSRALNTYVVWPSS